MWHPPLRALRAFEAAARRGSFTQAGNELNVTHSAISQQVRHLEGLLGTSLFTRRGNQIMLTSSGVAVFDVVHRAMKSLEGIQRLAISPDALVGEVTISAPLGFSNHWLIHRLDEFHNVFPDLKLRLITSNSEEEIWSDDVDICVRYGNGTWPRRNVALLADVHLSPICSPDLLAGTAGLEHPRDLRAFRILCADDGQEWNAWLGSVGMTDDLASNRYYFSNPLSASEACRAGFGVALGGNISSEYHIQQGELIRPLPQTVRMTRALFVVTRHQDEISPMVRATRGWLLDQFRTTPQPG